MSISDILKERKKTHGEWKNVAHTMWALRKIYEEQPGYRNMRPVMQMGVEQIIGKIARMVCGDGGFEDHIVDIIGYAKLYLDNIRENAVEDKAREYQDGAE